MRRHFSLLSEYFLQYSKVWLVVATLFGIAVVWLIFGRVPRVHGWSFYEILFLYGFALLPMSLFNMLSINLYYFGQNYIVEGRFDRVLLRPLHSLFQILFEQFRLEALGDLALGIFLIIVCAGKLGLTLGLSGWLFIAFAAVCGFTLYMAVFLMLSSVSFWVEDRVGIIPPVYNMLTFGRYPLDIYNPFVQFFLSWIVPFGFATFYPTASLLRADAYRLHAWLLPAVTAAFVALALLVWNRGVRNYSSTGS